MGRADSALLTLIGKRGVHLLKAATTRREKILADQCLGFGGILSLRSWSRWEGAVSCWKRHCPTSAPSKPARSPSPQATFANGGNNIGVYVPVFAAVAREQYRLIRRMTAAGKSRTTASTLWCASIYRRARVGGRRPRRVRMTTLAETSCPSRPDRGRLPSRSKSSAGAWGRSGTALPWRAGSACAIQDGATSDPWLWARPCAPRRPGY